MTRRRLIGYHGALIAFTAATRQHGNAANIDGALEMLIAIVQARMGSRRLPGKVLSPVVGEPLLARELERIVRARIDDVVVATSDDHTDDPIAQLAEARGYACYRGSLDDVLDRFHEAARAARADHVVRLTADCPLLDPCVIDRVVETHLRDCNDYTSNTLEPRTYPDGQDVEVLTASALDSAWREASASDEREHVTPFVNRRPGRFRIGSLSLAEDYSGYRWTVDYPEDLELVRRVFEALLARNAAFSMHDVLELFRRQPELEAVNRAVNARARGQSARSGRGLASNAGGSGPS